MEGPGPLLVLDSEKWQGQGSVGSFFFIWQALFLQNKRLFWFCGRMAFGEKDNQRKMGRLGILFLDSQSSG